MSNRHHTPPNLNQKDLARFYSRVPKGLSLSECWPWHGSAEYGSMSISRNGGRTAHRVHRLMFYLVFDDWPEIVCHKCDNPPCVNPCHLFGGDQRANMQDCSRKGRLGGSVLVRGAERSRAKLDDEKVRYIRSQRGAKSWRELGRMFGVSHFVVGAAQRGQTWKHVK